MSPFLSGLIVGLSLGVAGCVALYLLHRSESNHIIRRDNERREEALRRFNEGR